MTCSKIQSLGETLNKPESMAEVHKLSQLSLRSNSTFLQRVHVTPERSLIYETSPGKSLGAYKM